MSLNLITQVCVFVIITVGVNDVEREGHCSGVAGGTEDMYLTSPETFIKQHSVHIMSHHCLDLPTTMLAAYLYFIACTSKYFPCWSQKQMPNWSCRGDKISSVVPGGSEKV